MVQELSLALFGKRGPTKYLEEGTYNKANIIPVLWINRQKTSVNGNNSKR
jgi:hypothetical protein